jgi:hypothetical protein
LSLRARLLVVLALALVQTVLYVTLNHHPPRTSSLLPLTALDRALPFWPATVWAYFALLACQLVLPLLLRSREAFLRLLVAYALGMSVAVATYAFFPTHYPRPEPEHANWAWRLLIAQDTPECCLPSCHILVPALAAWALARERRAVWPLVLVALLTPSVLTTRQHYVWDILAALVLALLAWLASGWILARSEPSA